MWTPGGRYPETYFGRARPDLCESDRHSKGDGSGRPVYQRAERYTPEKILMVQNSKQMLIVICRVYPPGLGLLPSACSMSRCLACRGNIPLPGGRYFFVWCISTDSPRVSPILDHKHTSWFISIYQTSIRNSIGSCYLSEDNGHDTSGDQQTSLTMASSMERHCKSISKLSRRCCNGSNNMECEHSRPSANSYVQV